MRAELSVVFFLMLLMAPYTAHQAAAQEKACAEAGSFDEALHMALNPQELGLVVAPVEIASEARNLVNSTTPLIQEWNDISTRQTGDEYAREAANTILFDIVAVYEQAFKLSPCDAEIWNGLQEVYGLLLQETISSQDYMRWKYVLERYLTMDPDDMVSKRELAFVHIQLGDSNAGERVYRELERDYVLSGSDSTLRELRVELADAYLLSGKADSVLAVAERGSNSSRSEEDAVLWNQYADYASWDDGNMEGRELLAQSVQWTEQGLLARADSALAVLAQSVKTRDARNDVLLRWAYVKWDRGDRGTAAELLLTLLSKAPSFKEVKESYTKVILELADSAYVAEDRRMAHKYWLQVLSVDEGQYAAMAHMALANLMRNHPDEGRHHASRVLQLTSDSTLVAGARAYIRSHDQRRGIFQ